jgi:hypothetical protein
VSLLNSDWEILVSRSKQFIKVPSPTIVLRLRGILNRIMMTSKHAYSDLLATSKFTGIGVYAARLSYGAYCLSPIWLGRYRYITDPSSITWITSPGEIYAAEYHAVGMYIWYYLIMQTGRPNINSQLINTTSTPAICKYAG